MSDRPSSSEGGAGEDEGGLPEVPDVPEVADPSGADLADLLGGAGGLDASGEAGQGELGSLFEQAQSLVAGMAEAQQEAAETVVEGSAGGGAVRVVVSAAFEFQDVQIDAEAIDPSDPGMLEDLVLAALHDATRRVAEIQAQRLGALGDLGGFGDLLGGGGS